jgi:fructokinase
MPRLVGIEGGGTTWVASIGENSHDNIVARSEFPTTNPEETLGSIRMWLNEQTFDAVGIACFGPIEARVGVDRYGYITSTPKAGWRDADVLGLLGLRGGEIPVRFDTDVNAPALSDFDYFKTQTPPITSCAYITVGTGVGVGLVVNGLSVHGLMHPEAGHIRVPRFPDDTFPGSCPFHGDCIEGMCSTGALASRRGCSPSELPDLSDDDSLWDILANQLAHLCAHLILIVSVERISIGGGVLNRSSLYSKIRQNVQVILNG